jgi:trehalose 6-phosphate synthase
MPKMIGRNGRLIVVSNRVAAPDRDGVTPAGGLAVALRDALRTRRGLWFGWSGEVAEAPASKPRLILHGRDAYALIDLTEEQRSRYYTGFANRALWPLMHYRLGLTEFSREDYAGYLSVNERFADALTPLLMADDLVWIHDYHLIPLARMLRRQGFAGSIGYFHHIPWPPAEVFGALPCGDELLDAVTAYDLVGVQTHRDALNLLGCLGDLPGAELHGDMAQRNGDAVRVAAFPVGIDAQGFRQLAERSASAHKPAPRALATRTAASRFVIGVDRLDYSKGIVPRLLAFERFLEQNPERRRSVSLLQIAPPSRSDVPEYIELDRQTDETAGRINAALAEVDWTPVRVIKKSFARPSLAGHLRRAAVGLVTPMRDGMNLVAKEYVAAQDEADPGVLILSRFAGAARQLPAALIVNPFDLSDMSDALRIALDMPLDERLRRHRMLLRNVLAEDAAWWRDGYLKALSGMARSRTKTVLPTLRRSG